jgi:rRNA-processing protein FCF1
LEDNAIRGKDTHADPVLIRMAADIPNSLLITNDRELRILAKSQGIVAIGSSKF